MKAEEILRKMTLEEKTDFLSGKNNWETQDFPNHGIASVFMADGPCGLRKQTGKGDHLGIEDSVPATATVSGACLAAAWNKNCALENGRILGEEAAAENVDIILAPAMNLVRSPLCGRNFEYFSEDPYLTGEIAANCVEGIQSSGVGACPKHFAANNQETEREYVDALIDERTLRELYLPGFEKVMEKTKPAAIMTALNKINGSYGAEQRHLLTDILRDEWQYDGMTVSDWYGVVHRSEAVNAGLDLEMPGNGGIGKMQLMEALKSGNLEEEAVDRACLHLLNMLERIADLKKKRTNDNKENIYRRNHERCRQIAEEGIVLLKNEDGILPLSKEDKIAVIGCYAVSPKITVGGSARVISRNVDIPFQCMKKIAKDNVVWAAGFSEDGTSGSLMEEAVRIAADCDKVVYFMGQRAGIEMEGRDKADLSMPSEQIVLLEEICKVNPNIVVVLSNASAIEMPWKDRVKGIFECFLAGQAFGAAIVNLLYGEVSPSGKLPVTFTDCLEDTSAYFNFPGDGKCVSYHEGVFCGYRYYDKKRMHVLYPFGYGLSYTTFEYADLYVESERFSVGMDQLKVSVSVKNTGKVKGAEVVQLYIGNFDTDVKRPVKELKGFEKIYLNPSETARVDFYLNKKDFAYYDVFYKEWVVPEGNYEILIGSSSQDIRTAGQVYVESEKRHLPKITGWSTIGEFRQTALGERYYTKIMALLKECVKEDTVFLKISDLEDEQKMNGLALRFLNLLTNGILDSDTLMEWVDNVNRER